MIWHTINWTKRLNIIPSCSVYWIYNIKSKIYSEPIVTKTPTPYYADVMSDLMC